MGTFSSLTSVRLLCALAGVRADAQVLGTAARQKDLLQVPGREADADAAAAPGGKQLLKQRKKEERIIRRRRRCCCSCWRRCA